MTEIEDEVVAQLDGLVQEFILGNHRPGDNVPSTPKLMPIIERRNGACSILCRFLWEVDHGWRQKIDDFGDASAGASATNHKQGAERYLQ